MSVALTDNLRNLLPLTSTLKMEAPSFTEESAKHTTSRLWKHPRWQLDCLPLTRRDLDRTVTEILTYVADNSLYGSHPLRSLLNKPRLFSLILKRFIVNQLVTFTCVLHVSAGT
jgi:hypothetical protein